MDREGRFIDSLVLFAHYTSIENLLNILQSEEIWLSHPLMMNDVQELRYGMERGRREFLDQCGEYNNKYDRFRDEFNNISKQFEEDLEGDIYVFCMTQHDKEDNNGILSMWRGYGDQGGGAAIIINNKFIEKSGKSPILIPRIKYMCNEQRGQRIQKIVTKWFKKISSFKQPNSDDIRNAIFYLFDALLVQALSIKHIGFEEEREWRLVYLPYRDPDKVLVPFFHYHLQRGGVERKLKLPIKPPLGKDGRKWSFKEILDRIIIGPAASSPMARASLCRALKCIDRDWMAKKVVSSEIPFRRSSK